MSVKEEQPKSTSLLRPFWGFQFFITMIVYHLSAFLTLIPETYLAANYCLVSLTTSFIYVWITGIAIMNQRDIDNIRVNATFGFHLIGIPLFIVIGLMCYTAQSSITSFWAMKALLLLCFLLAAAFLVEILMVFPISRKNKRILSRQLGFKEESFDEEQVPTPPPDEPTKRDLTTSVSSLRLPPDADETTVPDHSYRKVSFARRREYVDAPTSVPSIAAVKMAEIQTEPRRVSVEASQTCKCELKEVLVQTVSRCEFCNQKMQAGAAAVPDQQPAICGSPCPTVVQLLRSGIPLPFCTNCSCAAGILQIEQQKQQTQHLEYKRKDQSQPQQLQYQRQEQPQPQQLQYQRQEQPQPQQLQYQRKEQPQPQQLQYQRQEQPQPQQLQYQRQEQPQPQQLQYQKQEQFQPQQKITQKTSQEVQPDEQRVQRTFSKESDRDGSQALTSFTKVTVTAFCAAPNATTMEVATSSGSRENVITTVIPPQIEPPTEMTGRPQITTTSQQTEKAASFAYSKVHRVMGGQGREIESSKEEAIFASECFDMETGIIDDEEYSKPPPQTVTPVSTLKSDDDDVKHDVKKNDTKEPRQSQVSKTSKETVPTGKSRRGREQSTATRHVKRTKRSAGQTTQKEKKEDVRTYSRFLPLDDIKPRDPRCIEQDYDLSNICIPMHTHEVVEFPSCSGNRPSVFHRNNRIDPAYIPECEGYAIQTDNPHFQCEIDTPGGTSTTPPDTTATTDTDICPACRKEQVEFPQADVFQYYNVYKDKEGRVYCDTCAPPNSNKVPIITDRSEDILQECSICNNFLYIIDARSVGVVYRHEERSSYCMKCGQLQS